MKTWWIAPAVIVVLIVGLVLWGTIPQCTKPDREPANPDTDTHEVEKEFSVEGNVERGT